jgi:hypothetical protein
MKFLGDRKLPIPSDEFSVIFSCYIFKFAAKLYKIVNLPKTIAYRVFSLYLEMLVEQI